MLGWLIGGHAAAGALYVALINVPDSNALMLGLSALLALLLLYTLATVEATAVAWLVPGATLRAALGRGVRAMPVVLAALALAGACQILADGLEAYARARAGEIDAWLIAAWDVMPTAWVHRTIAAAAFVLRWVVGVSLAVAALSAGIAGGPGRLLSTAWLRAGLSGQQLGLTAAALVLFVALPWRIAGWRPVWVPPTWIEVAFVALKLGALVVVGHVGWLLVLFAGVRGATSRA